MLPRFFSRQNTDERVSYFNSIALQLRGYLGAYDNDPHYQGHFHHLNDPITGDPTIGNNHFTDLFDSRLSQRSWCCRCWRRTFRKYQIWGNHYPHRNNLCLNTMASLLATAIVTVIIYFISLKS
jgi:hypothetical protein